MRMLLMRDEKPAAQLEAEIGPMAFLIKDAEATDPSLLPPGIRVPMKVCRGLGLKTAIARWLSNRQVPERNGSPENSSTVMGRAYRAGAGGLGRMYRTGHAAAALSYYISGADRYYLTPERAEAVLCMPENGGEPKTYRLEPCTEEMAGQIREGQWQAAWDAPDVFLPDAAYTVPSQCPSWWEWKGRWKCLVQEPGERGLLAYQTAIRRKFPSMDDKGRIRINFSHIKDDVLWLSDLLPCLTTDKNAWDQAAWFLRNFPGSAGALEKLKDCADASAEYQGPSGWSRIGVSCGKYRMEPAVIL